MARAIVYDRHMPTESHSDTGLKRYLSHITSLLRTPAQRAMFASYLRGLKSDAPRKSMQALAARQNPEHPSAAHKAICYFINDSVWRDDDVRRIGILWESRLRLNSQVIGTTIGVRHVTKQGKHSVGVMRQVDDVERTNSNCQAVVGAAIYTSKFAIPIDLDLFLPSPWIDDASLRGKARVPPEIGFRTKSAIAGEMLRRARAEAVPLGKILLAGIDCGPSWDIRAWCRQSGLSYVFEIPGTHTVWASNSGAKFRADECTSLVWKPDAKRYEWTASGAQPSWLVSLQANALDEDGQQAKNNSAETLVVERFADAADGCRYYLMWLSSPDQTLSWAIGETKAQTNFRRSFDSFSSTVGFSQFEGRSWPGWQHHASVAIACYSYIVRSREWDGWP